nr:MAG TPA: hypothetical protein [Bacteriophage sp.]
MGRTRYSLIAASPIRPGTCFACRVFNCTLDF